MPSTFDYNNHHKWDIAHMNSTRIALIAELARWALGIIVRRDAYGRYVLPVRRKDLKKIAYTEKSEPTEEVLRAHFSGGAVVGLHVLDGAGFCRLCLIDIDRHDENGSQEVNEKAAIALHDRAVSMGFSAFLEDSNGRGGYKLWLIFKETVLARWVRRYARWLVRDWEDLGLERVPEIFPKQDELGLGKLGNFVRLPGRHHTLDHESRIWGDGRWLEGEAAARRILSTVGSSAEVIPEEFRVEAAEQGHPSPAMPAGSRISSARIWLLRSAIAMFPVGTRGNYDEWIRIGMCLASLGDKGLELWEEFSRKCPNHREGACREKWRTFKPDGRLNWPTILHLAKQHGWKSPGRRKGEVVEDKFVETTGQDGHQSATLPVVEVRRSLPSGSFALGMAISRA